MTNGGCYGIQKIRFYFGYFIFHSCIERRPWKNPQAEGKPKFERGQAIPLYRLQGVLQQVSKIPLCFPLSVGTTFQMRICHMCRLSLEIPLSF